jgi:NAD(P)-dependent dehydrogenase (short-subunit alcohol dehydrogenase family)
MLHYFHSGEAAATRGRSPSYRSPGCHLRADLGRMEAYRRSSRRSTAPSGGLDVLVNSAALFEPVPLLEASEDDWRRTMDLTCGRPSACSRRPAA